MAVLTVTLQSALNAQTCPCQAALTKPLLLWGKRSGKCTVGDVYAQKCWDNFLKSALCSYHWAVNDCKETKIYIFYLLGFVNVAVDVLVVVTFFFFNHCWKSGVLQFGSVVWGPFCGCGVEFHPSLQHLCLTASIKAFSSCVFALRRFKEEIWEQILALGVLLWALQGWGDASGHLLATPCARDFLETTWSPWHWVCKHPRTNKHCTMGV